MFKRRKPRSYGQIATEFVWPRGGWRRAATYVALRVRRLPDMPHKIGRGVGAGIFISFTPFFGFHFLGAALIAWIIRGNIVAALLGTFVGNPLTTPFIAALSVGLGRAILGIHGGLNPHRIFGEFSRAGSELWNNILAPFTDRVAHWESLAAFHHEIFLPYLVGGLVPGLIAAVIGHYMTVPVIRAHHRRREKKMAARIARLSSDMVPETTQPPRSSDGSPPDPSA